LTIPVCDVEDSGSLLVWHAPGHWILWLWWLVAGAALLAAGAALLATGAALLAAGACLWDGGCTFFLTLH
jgi:hypothetical protein